MNHGPLQTGVRRGAETTADSTLEIESLAARKAWGEFHYELRWYSTDASRLPETRVAPAPMELVGRLAPDAGSSAGRLDA